MSLLQMSFAGAVMIVVITVIRAVTLNRLPKKTFLALWGIALVRLLVPFSLPSMFSVYSLFGKSTKISAVTGNPAAVLAPSVPTEQVTVTAEAVSKAATSIPVWTLIWAVGVLSCALFFGFTYWKCLREFQTSLPVENDFSKRWLAAHLVKRSISVRQSDRISAPLTFGIFHPVILMPKTTDWDDETALRYVLAHEFVHIRRFDALTKLALTAALCVHWFNPMVWVMVVLANRDLELSCDEAVVHQFGEDTKAAYARTLIRMEETKSGLRPLCNSFSKNAMEERIVAIMKTRKTTVFSIVLAALLVAGTATAFATSAKVNFSTSNEKTTPLVEAPSGTVLYGLEDGSPAEMSSSSSSFSSGALESLGGDGTSVSVWYQNTNEKPVSVTLYRDISSIFNQDATEVMLTFQVDAGQQTGMSCAGSNLAGSTYLVSVEVQDSGIGEKNSPEISGALLVTQGD